MRNMIGRTRKLLLMCKLDTTRADISTDCIEKNCYLYRTQYLSLSSETKKKKTFSHGGEHTTACREALCRIARHSCVCVCWAALFARQTLYNTQTLMEGERTGEKISVCSPMCANRARELAFDIYIPARLAIKNFLWICSG